MDINVDKNALESIMCMKHKKYQDTDKMGCNDPEIYCKFRPACPIWFMTRKMKNM
jgi:hypothetical protein